MPVRETFSAAEMAVLYYRRFKIGPTRPGGCNRGDSMRTSIIEIRDLETAKAKTRALTGTGRRAAA